MMNHRKTKKFKGKIGAITDNKEIITTVIITVILVLGISSIGYFIINKYFTSVDSNHPLAVMDDPWDKAFREIESNKVGVNFNTIVTTLDEYEYLRDACNIYLYDLRYVKDMDATISTDVIVAEYEFVDNMEDVLVGTPDAISEYKLVDTMNMVETGPIYFNDMFLVRYIDDNGNFAVISSAFKDENKVRNNVEIYKQSEMSDLVKTIRSRLGYGFVSMYDSTDQSLSEEDYINKIYNCIITLLKSDDDNIDEAVSKLLPYFTLEGKDTVILSKKGLNINKDTGTNMILGIAGKSNLEKSVKDRVYLQVELNNNGNLEVINIIVKLNSNLRIFDIDIV